MYREILPRSELADAARCFWIMERDYGGDPRGGETVWPDGKLEFIFHRSQAYAWERPTGPVPRPPGFLIGPLKRRLFLACSGRIELFGVRFHPWGYRRCFGDSFAGLADRIVPLSETPGRPSVTWKIPCAATRTRTSREPHWTEGTSTTPISTRISSGPWG